MELDSIKKKTIIYKIAVALLNKIYIYKMQGIYQDFTHNYDTKKIVYISRIASCIEDNIRLHIIRLTFLKTLNKKNTLIHKCVYGSCVECGLIHAQHKYRRCGHYVGLACAYTKSLSSNRCRKCNTEIVKRKIEFVKDKKNVECAICLEKCNTKLKNCNHYFHKKCLKLSYQNSNACPLCRGDIVQNKTVDIYKNTKFSIHKNFKQGLIDLIITTI